MSRTVKPLKDTQIFNAKPKADNYNLFDGDGLYIIIKTNGSKLWRFSYLSPSTSKRRLASFGRYPEISLERARELRLTWRSLIAQKIDPVDQAVQEKNKAHRDELKFEAVTREWFAMYDALGKWEADTSHKVMRLFENHLFPLIGDVPVPKLTTRQLKTAFEQIQTKKGLTSAAKKLKGKTVSILAYAVQEEYIPHNPAREMENVINSWTVKHRAALPLERIPELLQRIDADTGRPITKLCTQLTLHLFLRSSELRFARWEEIDFDNRMWTIPARRQAVEGAKYSNRGAKMRVKHFVPLSDQVIELLQELKQFSGYSKNLFPHESEPTKFISEGTVKQALERMGYNTSEDVTGHGFRSMAQGTLLECGLFNPDAIERQMSHKEPNAVRASYIHTAQFLAERADMMAFWSAYLQDSLQQGYIPARRYAQQHGHKYGRADIGSQLVGELMNFLQHGSRSANDEIIQFKQV